MTGTLITILMPLSACMEAIFAKRYEVRLEWDAEEKVVYFKSRGRRKPIFATSNKTQSQTRNQTQNQNQNQTQNQIQIQIQTQIQTVNSAV